VEKLEAHKRAVKVRLDRKPDR